MRKEKQLRNLPFGVVYYLESFENENLNMFVRLHHAECEAVMNSIPNLVTPFKLIYVQLLEKKSGLRNLFYRNRSYMEQNTLHKNLISRTLYKKGNWVVSSMSLENLFSTDSDSYNEEVQKNHILKCFMDFATTLQRLPQAKVQAENVLCEQNEVYQTKLSDREIAYRIMNDVNTLTEHQGLCLLKELYGMKIMLEKRSYQKIKYSRLRIDSEYNISLVDYNNQHVMMSPIIKTVYLLFIIHPEGIKIKETSDYKEDITYIYKQLTNKTSEEKIQSTIQRLINPAENAFMEKISSIRRCFKDTFMQLGLSMSKMQVYVPQGIRGELYKITLNRNIVMMTKSLKNLLN